MIKITGGVLKNKKLQSISDFVRPTSSLKREAFFSIIQSYAMKKSMNLFKNKIFLDLYAGIGTMGIEAISRGFEQAIFVENNIQVIKILKKNCKYLCLENSYEIIEKDVLNLNTDINFNNISVVYIDPPYFKYDIEEILLNLQKVLKNKTIVTVETSSSHKFNFPKKMQVINEKKYGKTKLCFFELS